MHLVGTKVFFRRDDHIVPLGIITEIIPSETSDPYQYKVKVTWENGVAAIHNRDCIGCAQAMIEALSKEVYLPG